MKKSPFKKKSKPVEKTAMTPKRCAAAFLRARLRKALKTLMTIEPADLAEICGLPRAMTPIKRDQIAEFGPKVAGAFLKKLDTLVD